MPSFGVRPSACPPFEGESSFEDSSRPFVFARFCHREKTLRCFSLKALAILANHRGGHLELSPRLRIPLSIFGRKFGTRRCGSRASVGCKRHYRNLQHGFLSPSTHGHVIELPVLFRANLSILSAFTQVGCPTFCAEEPRLLHAFRDRILMMRSPLGLVIRQVSEKRSTIEASPLVESFETHGANT